MTDRGERAVVVRLFPDGSAWVRIGEGEDEGLDFPLTAAQAGSVELGEGGRLLNRKRRGFPLEFVGRCASG